MWWRKKDEVKRWIAKLKKRNPDIRREAVEVLGNNGDPRAIGPLIRILEHDVLLVRRETAEALGKIGDAQAIEPLINALKDSDWVVRKNAAWALGRIGDPRVVVSLIGLFGDAFSPVQETGIEALGKIGDARAVEPLIQAFRDLEGDAQWRAAKALVDIEGIYAVEPLIQILGSTEGWIRESIIELLYKVCAPIDTIIFRYGKSKDMKQSTTWLNPKISELTISLSKLERIDIYSESYDFHLVEHFITYAVNYIGQEHLKERVEVHIHGDPDKLHPNLRNTFKNLCKCVEVHQ